MQSPRRRFVYAFRCLCAGSSVPAAVAAVVIVQALGCASVPVPNSNCYAFDNSNRLVDFSSLIGKEYEFALKDNTDLVVRFCKSVETRAQSGYVNYGRFDQFNYFASGSGHVDFVQVSDVKVPRFYGGDLTECERSYDHLGRTSQVNIACGSCLNGQCKGTPGCICNATFSYCRVSIDLAISCDQTGRRVFKGFTVGFHPRSWEIVYNGMTQLGFEKPYLDYSFRTEQTHATLYMTSIASLSTLVGKPTVEVVPKTGLDIKLSGTGAAGSPPTTLSPTTLILDWRCQEARDVPYEVNVTIPIQGHEPVQFFLAKLCEYRQAQEEESQQEWAIFGIISCIFMVSATLFCCGGFIYKTRMKQLRGVDALPGITILSACLETASGTVHGYSRPGDLNNGYSSEASWTWPSNSARGASTSGERKYGAM